MRHPEGLPGLNTFVRFRHLFLLATIVTASIMVLSGWWYPRVTLPLKDRGPTWGVTVFGGGGLVFWWDDAEHPYACEVSPSDGWGSWTWNSAFRNGPTNGWLQIPSWLAILAPGSLLFLARREMRRRRLANECAVCSYPLQWADRCPECGRHASHGAAVIAPAQLAG